MIIGMIIWLPWGHDKPAVQVTGVHICMYVVFTVVLTYICNLQLFSMTYIQISNTTLNFIVVYSFQP